MSRGQRFKILVGALEHEVEVEPGTDLAETRVRVNGRDFVVGSTADEGLVVRSDRDATLRTVWLSPGVRPRLAATRGRVLDVRVRTTGEAALEEAAAAAGSGPEAGARIEAPMPGRVVRVLVTPGEDVELDQPLVIVEAMKMENEVRATAAGRLAVVAVEAGNTVEAGQLLCEIVPHSDAP